MNASPDSCRDGLKADINENWKSSYGYYLTTQNFTNRIDIFYAPCILQMQKQELIDIFGEPTITDYSSITYKVIAADNNGKIADSHCKYIIFYLDEDENIQGYQGYYKE